MKKLFVLLVLAGAGYWGYQVWRDSQRVFGAVKGFIASVPLGMSISELGKPYDEYFRRLEGPNGATLYPDAPLPTPFPQDTVTAEYRIVEDEKILAANASAWGIVDASVSKGTLEQYATYRAMIIREVYEIDDTTAMRNVPPGAKYYPARIFMGHSYEVVLSGSSTDFDARVEANFLVASGSIEWFASRYKLKTKTFGRGLAPKTEKAIFAQTGDEIKTHYGLEKPVPILVEWREVPGYNPPKDHEQ